MRTTLPRLTLITFLAKPGAAQSAPTADETKAAVNKGVAWLLRHQQSDGHFRLESDPKAPPLSLRGVMTALSVMALYHAGHRPSASTPEGEAMTHGRNEKSVGTLYATALAVMALSISVEGP